MQRVLLQLVRHPRVSIVLALALTLGLASGLPRLEIDNSSRSLFLASDPDFTYYRNVQANFGGAPDLTVVFRSSSLFSPAIFAEVKRLASSLSGVSGVEEAVSLFSIDTLRRTTSENGGGNSTRISTGPLIESIPDSPAGLESLKNEILSDEILRGNLISETGEALAIHLYLDKEHQARNGSDEQIVSDTSAVIREFEETFSADRNEAGPKVYLVGNTFIKAAVTKSLWRDLVLLGPLAIGVVAAVVFLFFRSFVVVVLPLLTGAMSALATLGLMGYLGYAINPVSSTIVLLILVVGCTEDLHLISDFLREVRNRNSRNEAIRAMIRNVVPATSLAVLTTILGFLAIAPNPIPTLQEFALSCAAGLAINYVLTLLLVPSVLILFPLSKSLRSARPTNWSAEAILERFVVPVIHRPSWLLPGILSAAMVAGIGVFLLKIDTRYLRFFAKDSAVIQSIKDYSEDFGGVSMFSITLETNRRNGVFEPAVLQSMSEFTGRLEERFDHVLSVVPLLQKVHTGIRAPSTGGGKHLPSTAEEIDESVSLIPPSVLHAFVDHDGSRALLRVRSSSRGSRGMQEDTSEVMQLAEEHLPDGIHVRITGELPLLHGYSDLVSRQLIQGLLLLLGAVTVIFLFHFRSFRLVMVGIIANGFPVLVTLGFMGLAGIPLSVGTFSVAIVALGISVDDTIHFLVRYRDELRDSADSSTAASQALRKEFRPVFVTTIALTAGFLVLILSSLVVNRETGLLYSVAFLSALIADLFLLPSFFLRKRA